jgi:DNA-binding response OmpR family regulator
MSAPLILLVSSDPVAETAVRAALASSRRELRQLGSDYGAMAVIQSELREAALALVDLDPGLHGHELCRAAAHHMPVIVLTSDAGPTVEETARECGASGCLHKPLDAEQVRSLLDQTLGVEAPLEL